MNIIRRASVSGATTVLARTVVERLVSFVDLGPTILSLAGLPVPGYLQGTSFAEVGTTTRKYIYASRDRIDEVMDRQRAVRDKHYKYLRSWYPQQPGGHALKFRDNIDMVREMRALYEAGELNEAQSAWYEPPGEERLFDLEQDPFELNNVIGDPQYFRVVQRMRGEMNSWLSQVGDWSEESEGDMVARFEPDGERQVTPVPTLSVTGGTLVITPHTLGHSVEYRLDGSRWQLYSAPVRVETTTEIEVRAVRYGWEESEIVSGP